MNTRRASCSCGQLQLTIEGEPSRNYVSLLGVPAPHGGRAQQPGALSPGADLLCREDYGRDSDGRKRQRDDLSFLSDMRLDSLLLS
jgi:hypothetical protein